MLWVSDAWKENQKRLLTDRVGLCIKVYTKSVHEYIARIADFADTSHETPVISAGNILGMTYTASFDELSLESPRLEVQLRLSNTDGVNNELWNKLMEYAGQEAECSWDIYAVYGTAVLSPEYVLLASLVMSQKALSSDENVITITLVPEFAFKWDTMFIPEARDFSSPGGTFQYDIYDVIGKLNQELDSNISIGGLTSRILMLGMPFKQQKAGDALQLIANAFGLSVVYRLYQPSGADAYSITAPRIIDPLMQGNAPQDYFLGSRVLYEYPYVKTPEKVNTIIETPSYAPYKAGSSEHLGTSFNLACPYLSNNESAWIDYPKVLVEDLYYRFGFQEEESQDIPIDIIKSGVAGCLIKNTGGAALASGYILYVEGYFSDTFYRSYQIYSAADNGRNQTIRNELGMNVTEFMRSFNQIQGKDIYEVSFRADPRLECGDFVILTTKRKKVIAKVLKLTYEYDGAWKGSATLRHIDDVAPLQLIADDTLFLTDALT